MSFTVTILPSVLDSDKMSSRHPEGDGPDPATAWILFYGEWQDDHVWSDTDNWID